MMPSARSPNGSCNKVVRKRTVTIKGDERRARQKAKKLLPCCTSNAASRPLRACHAIDALADLKWHRPVDVKAEFDENQVGAFAFGGRVATGFCSPDWLSYAAIIPATHAVKHHHSTRRQDAGVQRCRLRRESRVAQ